MHFFILPNFIDNYFFKKSLNATATRPQSIINAPISTASAPPDIIAMSVPPYIHPKQAHITMRIMSKPRIPPVTIADCLIVGLSCM